MISDIDYIDDYESYDDGESTPDASLHEEALLTFVRKKEVVNYNKDADSILDSLPPALEEASSNEVAPAPTIAKNGSVFSNAVSDIDAARRLLRYKSLKSHKDLPIYQQRHEIISSINDHAITIINCETGSGKSTQVPQYCLYSNPILNQPDSTKPPPPHGPSSRPSIWMSVPRKLCSSSLYQRLQDELTYTQSLLADDVERMNVDFPSISAGEEANESRLVSHLMNTKVFQTLYDAHQACYKRPRDLTSASGGPVIVVTTDFDMTYHISRHIRLLRAHFNSKTSSAPPPPPPFSILIIDEIHERTLYTDILLSLTMELIQLYRAASQLQTPHGNANTRSMDDGSDLPFRVVLMSATLSLDTLHTFIRPYTTSINTIISEVKTYPVEIRYSDTLNYDYVHAAAQLCFDVHTQYPHGDILVFLSNRRELQQCEEKFLELIQGAISDGFEVIQNDELDALLNITHDQQFVSGEDSDADREHSVILPPSKMYDVATIQISSAHRSTTQLFAQADRLTRKIIFSTSVCETSLTVPGVTYVIDSGYTETTVLATSHAVSTAIKGNITSRPHITLNQYETVTTTISQHQAIQRAGRAGRTRPGVCFRLYTTGIYKSLNYSTIPEIHRTSLFSVFLLLLSLGIPLPFLSFYEPPQQDDVLLALQWLRIMDFIDDYGRITLFGLAVHSLSQKVKSCFRRYAPAATSEMLFINSARLLLYGRALECLEPIVWAITYLCRLGEPRAQHSIVQCSTPKCDSCIPNIQSSHGDVSTLIIALAAFFASRNDPTQLVIPHLDLSLLTHLEKQSKEVLHTFRGWEQSFVRTIPSVMSQLTTSQSIARSLKRDASHYFKLFETYFIPPPQQLHGAPLLDRVQYVWLSTFFYNAVIFVDSVFQHLLPSLRSNNGSTLSVKRSERLQPSSILMADLFIHQPSSHDSKMYVYADLSGVNRMVLLEECAYDWLRRILKHIPLRDAMTDTLHKMIQTHQTFRDRWDLLTTPHQLAAMHMRSDSRGTPVTAQSDPITSEWSQKLSLARQRYLQRRQSRQDSQQS